MSLDAIEFRSLDDVYNFVEACIQRTGLILDCDAPFRPWARTLAAQTRGLRWLHPATRVSEQILQHFSNFAHTPVVEKGFVLIENGRVLGAMDVDAIGGSSQPHRLAVVVEEFFTARRATETRGWRRDSKTANSAPADDPFAILGVEATDTIEVIKKKYRSLVMQYHPDRVAHLGPELRDLAAKKTREINQAFAALRRQRGF